MESKTVEAEAAELFAAVMALEYGTAHWFNPLDLGNPYEDVASATRRLGNDADVFIEFTSSREPDQAFLVAKPGHPSSLIDV